MDSVKPRHDLRYISDVSNLVALIVLKIKEKYGNVDIATIKKNKQLIVFIMELIEAGVIQDKLISKKLVDKLDKNKLVVDIFEATFGNLTEDDMKQIEDDIQFILNNKLIPKKSFFFRLLRRLAVRVCTYFVA
jgi:hypothetical protein